MELSSSDKERIQHQYDALAKKTLVGEAKSHRRTLAKRAAREVTFSDLSESELAQLFTTDEYESDYFRFQVSGFDVLVKNELLAEALNALPERKRDIILLSYFLDMSDAEIGELLMLYARRFSGTGNPRLRKSNSIWREKQMMNTVRKSENLLPFPVISAAANGDTTAMCAILKHYEGYIAKLCTRTLKDDAGNTYSYVDEEMRNRLQVRLITRTLAFHVG